LTLSLISPKWKVLQNKNIGIYNAKTIYNWTSQ
jgi:hypothetical protein